MRSMVAITAAFLVLAACAGDGSGIPDPVAPACSGLEPRLSCIQEFVFNSSCATSGCHDLPSASAGLVLEAGVSHSELVGVAAASDGTLQRVEANNPDDSFLIIKLEATDPRLVGSPMPLDSPALSTAEIQAIRDWIANGALDD